MTWAVRLRGGSRCSMFLVAALLALLAPSAATAATIVNGDFESGTLRGWHVLDVTGAGNWFAYEGTEAPIGRHYRGVDPVQAPPQGVYAGIADQANPDTQILYQDIALEARSNDRLSLLAYYDSYQPISVPTPDTLSVDDTVLAGQKNQQYRIDLMKPDAPIESVDPADILRTLFRTKPGDPISMPPTKLTTDLSPFAGQTVRLRIANAAHEEVFNAGIDAVSIFSTASGHSPPRGSSRNPSRFSLGKAQANRRNGTVILPVRVPGPGLLTVKSKGISVPTRAARVRKTREFKAIKPATVRVARASTVRIRLKPTPSARVSLKQKHRLRVKVVVTYTPTDGSVETASLLVVLKLKAPVRQAR